MNIDKKQQINKLSPKRYKIYGIFDFNSNRLVYVDLDIEKVMFEFDLEEYDIEQYDIISFNIVLI
jgi:hypothetical protein